MFTQCCVWQNTEQNSFYVSLLRYMVSYFGSVLKIQMNNQQVWYYCTWLRPRRQHIIITNLWDLYWLNKIFIKIKSDLEPHLKKNTKSKHCLKYQRVNIPINVPSIIHLHILNWRQNSLCHLFIHVQFIVSKLA